MHAYVHTYMHTYIYILTHALICMHVCRSKAGGGGGGGSRKDCGGDATQRHIRAYGEAKSISSRVKVLIIKY
jgi:hypothetical protein